MSEARRLRGLEEENQRLKRLVAEQALDIQVLKEVPEKTGKARRTPLGRALCHRCAWLFRAAGLLANGDEPTDLQTATSLDRDGELRIRLRGLAEERRHFGSPRLQILLRREGIIVNHKRVERVYREDQAVAQAQAPLHAGKPFAGGAPKWCTVLR